MPNKKVLPKVNEAEAMDALRQAVRYAHEWFCGLPSEQREAYSGVAVAFDSAGLTVTVSLLAREGHPSSVEGGSVNAE